MLTQHETEVPLPVLATPQRESRGRARRPLQRLVSAPWFLPVLLAFALGLYRCTSIVLWWDELSTLDIAERPVSNILTTARHVDAVHSFYYLFMHFWIAAFGHSILAVRLPSVLAMCGATVCTAMIAQRLFDRRVAVISATLFALIPGVARYATEARSYGFVVLGSAVAFLLLLRALEKSTRGRWVAYGAVLAVTGALNLIALTAVASHLVTVWLTARSRGRRSMFRPFLLVVFGVVVLESPIMIFGMMEARSQLGHLPDTSLSTLPTMWEETGCSTAFSVIVLLALPVLLTHRRRVAALTVFSAAVLPVLVLWFVSLNGIGFGYFARYLLFVLPAWAMAVAAAVDRLKGPNPAACLAIVLVTALAVAHDQVVLHTELSHFDYDYPGPSVVSEDYPAAADIIEARYRPGDAASFAGSPHLDLGVNYYLPADEQLRDIFTQQTDVQTDSLVPEFCTDTAACMAKAPDRVWMVESGDVVPYTTERVDWEFSLMMTYRIVEIWHVDGITLTLLER